MFEKYLYDNLKNMEYFFRECLGFDCFWTRDKQFFPKYLDKDSLVLQTMCPFHVAKYMAKDEAINWGIDPQSIESEDISNNDKGLQLRTQNWFPYILLQTSIDSDALLDVRGDYYCRISGVIADKIIKYVGYFCCCFKRNEQCFKALPNDIVNEIETFLINHNLKIYGKQL